MLFSHNITVNKNPVENNLHDDRISGSVIDLMMVFNMDCVFKTNLSFASSIVSRTDCLLQRL